MQQQKWNYPKCIQWSHVQGHTSYIKHLYAVEIIRRGQRWPGECIELPLAVNETFLSMFHTAWHNYGISMKNGTTNCGVKMSHIYTGSVSCRMAYMKCKDICIERAWRTTFLWGSDLLWLYWVTSLKVVQIMMEPTEWNVFVYLYRPLL